MHDRTYTKCSELVWYDWPKILSLVTCWSSSILYCMVPYCMVPSHLWWPWVLWCTMQLLDGYFDISTAGVKTDAKSYEVISQAIRVDPSKILFLTDIFAGRPKVIIIISPHWRSLQHRQTTVLHQLVSSYACKLPNLVNHLNPCHPWLSFPSLGAYFIALIVDHCFSCVCCIIQIISCTFVSRIPHILWVSEKKNWSMNRTGI